MREFRDTKEKCFDILYCSLFFVQYNTFSFSKENEKEIISFSSMERISFSYMMSRKAGSSLPWKQKYVEYEIFSLHK